jgi:hypothetical protein
MLLEGSDVLLSIGRSCLVDSYFVILLTCLSDNITYAERASLILFLLISKIHTAKENVLEYLLNGACHIGMYNYLQYKYSFMNFYKKI